MDTYTVLRGIMGGGNAVGVDDVFMVAVKFDNVVYNLSQKDGVGIEGRSTMDTLCFFVIFVSLGSVEDIVYI